MTGAARFVCSDPDAGDFAFTDVEAVLDALEAALVQPETPLFDAARQSWQPAGLHPEIRAGWEARLRYRPAVATGLALPELPTRTALARRRPGDEDERAQRREAFARQRAAAPARRAAAGPRGSSFGAIGLVWALIVLVVVGWVVVVLAVRLTGLAAAAAGMAGQK